jgi:hypothetical protein
MKNNWGLKSCSSALKHIEEGLGGRSLPLQTTKASSRSNDNLGVEIVDTSLMIKVLPVSYICY